MIRILQSLSRLRRRRFTIRALILSTMFFIGCLGCEIVLLPLIWHAPIGAQHHRYPASTVIIDATQKTLRVCANAHGERCLPIASADISPHIINALIAAEDKRFHQHSGCDWIALGRASIGNLWRGKRISGASTITMQWTRIIEPRPRTYRSKIIEILRARQWERNLSKQEILNAYLNYAPWGGTLRGVEAASRYWFHKHAADLDPSEAATLIAMLPAPSARRPDRAHIIPFRNTILNRMRQHHMLTHTQWHHAHHSRQHASAQRWPFHAPHACNLALQNLQSPIVTAIHSPRNSYPTITLSINLAEQTSILRSYQQRFHNANPAHSAAINGLAVVVYDHHGISSLIGSPAFTTSQWNAAIHPHDAGSTLKPFLYTLALEQGRVHQHSRINDRSTEFSSSTSSTSYRPKNFDHAYKGSMRLGDSLSQSRNIPAVHLLATIGTEAFRQRLTSHHLISADSQLHLDSALGTNAVSPLQLAHAYHTEFCTDPSQPHHNNIAQQHVATFLAMRCPDTQQLSNRTHSLSWKTGTSSARRNAWSIIWNQQRVIVVWMGNLNGSPNANCYGSGICNEFASTLASALL